MKELKSVFKYIFLETLLLKYFIHNLFYEIRSQSSEVNKISERAHYLNFKSSNNRHVGFINGKFIFLSSFLVTFVMIIRKSFTHAALAKKKLFKIDS